MEKYFHKLKLEFRKFFVSTGAIFNFQEIKNHVYQNQDLYGELIELMPDVHSEDKKCSDAQLSSNKKTVKVSDFDLPDNIFEIENKSIEFLYSMLTLK